MSVQFSFAATVGLSFFVDEYPNNQRVALRNHCIPFGVRYVGAGKSDCRIIAADGYETLFKPQKIQSHDAMGTHTRVAFAVRQDAKQDINRLNSPSVHNRSLLWNQ